MREQLPCIMCGRRFQRAIWHAVKCFSCARCCGYTQAEYAAIYNLNRREWRWADLTLANRKSSG